MNALANIEQLRIVFEQPEHPLTAIDSLNFDIQPGETLALLGETGCGKSLVAMALMRLLPNNAYYGRASKVIVAEQDLLNLPEFLMRQLRGRKLSIIFQEPMTALNPVLTIRQQLAEALADYRTLSRGGLNARLLALLEKVEMNDPAVCLDKYPHQLSGGQKQRVVIAMALANDPQVLIADEPTTALDVTIQAQILALLKKLQREQGMSMLFITHDLMVVKAIADRVCVMYAGQLVEEALVNDFFSRPLHPYTHQLMGSIPSFAKRQQPLQAIPGLVPGLGNMPTGCRFHPRCAYCFAPCKTIEPLLQDKGQGQVRCHLYPRESALPALETSATSWETIKRTAEPLLEARGIEVYFSHRKGMLHKKQVIKAVDGVSLTLYHGKTLALVGESGCGKTTTSRALLGLVPLSGGEIQYRNQSIPALHGSALRRYRQNVQIVFQDPFSSMNPRMTVAEIMAEGMVVQGWSTKSIRQRLTTLLEWVRLPQTSLTRYPHQFSGGQRQRICIARALATNPEILICDEPTSALDMSVQAQLLNLLKSLQQELGIAYLFITHNMGVVAYMADAVQVMKDGKTVESGTCEQIFKNPQQAYTKELLSSFDGRL